MKRGERTNERERHDIGLAKFHEKYMWGASLPSQFGLLGFVIKARFGFGPIIKQSTGVPYDLL